MIFFGMKGVSKRSAFIVNSNLEVEYSEVNDDAGKQPDFRTLLEVLK